MKIGDKVRYTPILGEKHDGKVYEVRAMGDIPSQKNVVWLTGKAGCVCAEAVFPVEEDPKS